MRCIFCKKDSSEAKSIEHVIPESLGNKSFVLPKGFVCDKCNNYFAHEIERPFLEQMNIRLLRFEEGIPNKKNRIPQIKGVIGDDEVTIHKKLINNEVIFEIDASPELFANLLQGNGKASLIIPAFNENDLPPNNNITSRFIAKIAFEALSVKVKDDPEWLDFLIDSQQFDAIRNHVRLGTTNNWPCNIRRIYKTDKIWCLDKEGGFQKIHESMFFVPNYLETLSDESGIVLCELYFIVALWGIEFAINIGGPKIEGYRKWLANHNDVSPLWDGDDSNSLYKDL